ncbi:MAG: cupin domain-containing protein [Pseudomonadota bacterium]|nr:cupin domain-containing protein [Pseudomonadota bacterium]
MPNFRLPALDPATVEERRGSGYPEPFRSRMGDRMKRCLGDACGLTRLGVNLVTLGLDGQSALRHWHTEEDEFVYVLEGEVVLVTDDGEQVLRMGDCAGYPAGRRNGHHFVNRSGAPACYLEIGNRDPADSAAYPDDDLTWVEDAQGEYYAHKDGRAYEPSPSRS